MTRKADRWMRCVACDEPANSLSRDGGWCLRHAAERSISDGGGWTQFSLRALILIPETDARRRRGALRLSV